MERSPPHANAVAVSPPSRVMQSPGGERSCGATGGSPARSGAAVRHRGRGGRVARKTGQLKRAERKKTGELERSAEELAKKPERFKALLAARRTFQSPGAENPAAQARRAALRRAKTPHERGQRPVSHDARGTTMSPHGINGAFRLGERIRRRRLINWRVSCFTDGCCSA